MFYRTLGLTDTRIRLASLAVAEVRETMLRVAAALADAATNGTPDDVIACEKMAQETGNTLLSLRVFCRIAAERPNEVVSIDHNGVVHYVPGFLPVGDADAGDDFPRPMGAPSRR